MGEITNNDLYKLIQTLNAKSDQIRDELLNVRKDLNRELDRISNENQQLKAENKILEERLEKVEQKLKKYNIIVYGLEEADCEEIDNQTFLEVINKKLEIDCRLEDLRDIYRFGDSVPGKIRPLFVEFINYKLKTAIIGQTKKLKGSKIFFAQDYTTQQYKKQKVLQQNLKKARDNNQKAVIKKNILYINGIGYTYEKLLQDTGNSSTEEIISPSKQQAENVQDKPSDGEIAADSDKNRKRKHQTNLDSTQSTKRTTRLTSKTDT